MKILLDLAPITPEMEVKFFIQDNLWIVIGAVAVAVIAAVLIVKAVKKKK